MLSLCNITYTFFLSLFFSSYAMSQIIDVDNLSRFDYQYEFIFFSHIEFNEEVEAETFIHELPLWLLDINEPKKINQVKAICKNIDLSMNELHKLKPITASTSNLPYSQILTCDDSSILCASEQILFNFKDDELVEQVSKVISPIKMLSDDNFLLMLVQQRISSLRPYRLIEHIGFLLDIDEIRSDYEVTNLAAINSSLSGNIMISSSQANRVELAVSWISDFHYSLNTSNDDHLTTFEGIKKYSINDSQTITLNSVYYFDHPAFGVIATVKRFDYEIDSKVL